MDYIFDKKDVINKYVRYTKLVEGLEKIQTMMDSSPQKAKKSLRRVYSSYKHMADYEFGDYSKKLLLLGSQDKAEVEDYIKSKDKSPIIDK